MGLLVDGQWKDKWYETKQNSGEFVRPATKFNAIIEQGGKFPPETDRYHLYVSLACPWAHRTLILRALKNLENIITVDIVHPDMLENGWEFKSDIYGKFEDSLNGYQFAHQLYTKTDPKYTGRVTVPILWDKKNKVIVNNESSDLVRIFNTQFNKYTDVNYDFYPAKLQKEINQINDFVYENINNGVYKCGFATTQEAYNDACKNLFMALDEIEKRLDTNKYLVGDNITEADWKLFTTIVRFDPVYFGHFKANIRQIKDYKNIYNYMKNLYNYPKVKQTVDFDHLKRHYYYSHNMINPTRIIPSGPEIVL